MQTAIAPRSPSTLGERAAAHRRPAQVAVPRWRAYREALIASFTQGRWQLSAYETPVFSDTLIEIEELPAGR